MDSTETEVQGLFDSRSNVGRRGPDDSLGTLNHITRERQLAALRLPQIGRVVLFGHDLVVRATSQAVPSAQLRPRYFEMDGRTHAQDSLELSVHGFEAIF